MNFWIVVKKISGILSSISDSELKETISNIEHQFDEEADNLSFQKYSGEDAILINNSIEEVLNSSSDKTKSTIKQKIEEYKDNHYLQYIFILVLLNIIQLMISPIISEMGSKAISKVESFIKSDIENKNNILVVPKNAEMTVVGNEPYYYEIVYEDPNTKKLTRGFIAKKMYI